jgi:hypothetical protein
VAELGETLKVLLIRIQMNCYKDVRDSKEETWNKHGKNKTISAMVLKKSRNNGGEEKM